jgi:hypothetical protein
LQFNKKEDMKFKIGDKVKFLNTTGGGVISKIIDKNMVNVAIEDGFEVPVMASDLIITGTVSNPAANLFRKTQQEDQVATPNVVSARSDAQNAMTPGRYAGKEMEEGIYLAFRPMDQRILTIGDMEVLLVNHTEFPISSQLYLQQNNALALTSTISHGARQSAILQQLDRKNLESWLHGAIQFMIQPKQIVTLMLPVHTTFHLKGSRFFREDAYENTSLDPHRIIAILLKSATSLQPSGNKAITPPEKSTKAISTPIQPKQEPFIQRHMNADGFAEVDLHLQHLIQDHRSLNPMESLSFQMGYFRKALDSAILARVPKMIVIHGVGSGILKAEILKAVEEVNFAHAYDAPIQKYGIGATVVEFFHTKNV